ncbi:MAG TPA: ABC transporter ATP-binding protein [Methyloversatilis sp.]
MSLAGMGPQAAPLIEIRDAALSYPNGTVALEGVNLSVGQHEFLSLVGPSGCGKSTLLRLIAGLMAPSAGSVATVSGSTGDVPEIGFVFQEPTLMPWARVFDNVHLPLRLKGLSPAEARPQVEQALEMVGLSDFRHAYPRELSGGMKMRVSIARALVTRPTLLLMDEPFAALDDMTRHRLNDDLLELWSGQHWTVVFVTHSIYEAVYLSNRVAVMAARPGRIVADLHVAPPCPRDREYRLSAAYSAHCRAVTDALARAGVPDA